LSRKQHTLLTDLNIRYETTVNLSDRDIVGAYERADIVLFASLSEGFGLPVIEANAIGRPVITSNIAPMKDVAGNSACLVDPTDVADIRRGIRRVIDDRDYRDALISHGYVNASLYTSERIADQYSQLYLATEH